MKMANTFADNVLSMHKQEVFGLNVKMQWNCIFKDYLILKTLNNCSNNLNQEEVEFLFGKITNIK